ncbi:hypothetical protein Avbf_05719 [Armadillidium vulgare]|nr:hypothetical protein Avbf_05719 [Armadillidium vulgare]
MVKNKTVRYSNNIYNQDESMKLNYSFKCNSFYFNLKRSNRDVDLQMGRQSLDQISRSAENIFILVNLCKIIFFNR